MIRTAKRSHETTITHNDEKDIERSFSSENIHQDIHRLIGHSTSNTSNILRMPTVEEELFEELLNMNKKPICVCGRALRPIKNKFVGLYCHSFDANVYPSCSECNISFDPNLNVNVNTKYNNQSSLHDDIIWLCPSKQLYPHLFGFFLCKTCCVEQMLSNQWTKQFSSTNKILNFMLNELEKLEQKEVDIDIKISINDCDNINKTTKKNQGQHSKVLSKMRSQSKIDLNLVYRGDSDILSIDGKEKYIAMKLMDERKKELASIFANLYDLHQFFSLLEYVCADIVDFEFGYKFNHKNVKTSGTNDMTYFEHIFKMTAWTEIRRKLHSTRIEWNAENIIWTNCLQKCLTKCCYCVGKKGECLKANDDEYECCWAKMEFWFMGSIRLGYISLILRYIYITLIILIIYFSYYAETSSDNLVCLYFYYGFIGLAALELLIINYIHHFVTMFKLKTILKWKYKTVPRSILTGLIIDDLILFNSPPLIIVDIENLLPRTIGVLRQLLMLNSMKLSVMIISSLLQIQNEPITCSNVVLSLILTFCVIVYCICLHCFTNKYYLRENDVSKPFGNYKVIYLGLFSLLVLTTLTALNEIVRDWFFLVLILYPFFLFLTTTLAVSSSCLWIMMSFSCHYNFMHESVADNKTIFWMIALVIGFILCEFETRRISRGLRWADMKREDNWVRGGCLTNCWLHFCCGGCSSD